MCSHIHTGPNATHRTHIPTFPQTHVLLTQHIQDCSSGLLLTVQAKNLTDSFHTLVGTHIGVSSTWMHESLALIGTLCVRVTGGAGPGWPRGDPREPVQGPGGVPLFCQRSSPAILKAQKPEIRRPRLALWGAAGPPSTVPRPEVLCSCDQQSPQNTSSRFWCLWKYEEGLCDPCPLAGLISPGWG